MVSAPEGARILGFEFVEYAAPDPAAFGAYLTRLGFTAIGRHRSKEVLLYRQNQINIIVNSDVQSFEASYSHLRGARICAIALRVPDAAAAYEHALRQGAWEVESPVRAMEVNIPGIAAAGETVTYFVDRFDRPSIYDVDFVPVERQGSAPGAGLTRIRSVTYSVRDGRVQECAAFCVSVLGMEAEEDRSSAAHPGAGTATVRAADDSVRLTFAESARSSGEPSSVGRGLDFAQHVTLETADMEATVRAFNARGIGVDRDTVAGNGRPRRLLTPRHADTVFFEVIEASSR
jgi:4-hydroxyphenylpyruvate dioxygenase